MSLREELDQFLTAHSGIEHLVFGDLSTGMVLYGGSASPRAQEDHDKLLEQGLKAFQNATLDVEAPDGLQIMIAAKNRYLMFVRASQDSDEGLFFELAGIEGAFDVADAASQALVKFAAD